jgi:hypothetical protein
MPRTCTICRHEKRDEVDEALVAGEPYRSIALRFDTSHMAVKRHKEHLPGKLVKAAERREERRGDSLLEKVDALAVRTQALLAEVFPETKQSGKKINPRDVAAVVREVRETLRLTAQLTGQLKGDGATANVGVAVLTSPEWRRVAAAVTNALQDEPEARAKVADALAHRADERPLLLTG